MSDTEKPQVFCGNCGDTGYVEITNPVDGLPDDQYLPCRECDVWSTIHDEYELSDPEIDYSLGSEAEDSVDDDWVGDAR